MNRFHRTRFFVFVLAILTLGPVQGAPDPLIQNISGRQITSLNGEWAYIVDPYENGYYNYRYQPFDQQANPEKSGGYFANLKPTSISDRIEYDFDSSEKMIIPGDWNSQKTELYYYEGTLWLKRSFDFTPSEKDARVFLHFGAINYHAEVYLNGAKLGEHRGGFTPFNFEVTEHIRPIDNFVVVKVNNNRHKDEVPTVNTDWWNFGGITRDVTLVEVPGTYIRDYMIQLDKDSHNTIKGVIELAGPKSAGTRVRVKIPGLGLNKRFKADGDGKIAFQFKARDIRHWSPEDQHLYTVSLTTKKDKVTDRIGFRTIRTEGASILLNGKPVFLRGISLHEENPLRGGRANSPEDAKLLLGWAKELGCNFVRLAHYPHNEHTVRLAEEMGIMLWAENPVYWTISWENEHTYGRAEQQLRELIDRDKNRAAVIIWSMANETPVSDARMTFLKGLRDVALSMDETRLISAALEMHGSGEGGLTRSISDPFAEYVDILAFNLYVGWYDGLPDKCASIQWNILQDKPVFVSEFGGGALQGLHGDPLERWTEEYQEYLYIESLKMFSRIPQFRGTSPWILTDFHSPRRVLPKIQDDWNRKGLIGSNGQKKKAFYVLHDFYKDQEQETLQSSQKNTEK